MSINLRGFYIAMTELFLHGADIGAGFQQVGGETMTQRVASDVFADLSLKGCKLYRFAHASFIEMVTADKL